MDVNPDLPIVVFKFPVQEIFNQICYVIVLVNGLIIGIWIVRYCFVLYKRLLQYADDRDRTARDEKLTERAREKAAARIVYEEELKNQREARRLARLEAFRSQMIEQGEFYDAMELRNSQYRRPEMVYDVFEIDDDDDDVIIEE